jgi:hypothetical protein
MRSHFTSASEIRDGIHIVVGVRAGELESDNLTAHIRRTVLKLSDRHEFFISFLNTDAELVYLEKYFDGELKRRVEGADDILEYLEEFIEKNAS